MTTNMFNETLAQLKALDPEKVQAQNNREIKRPLPFRSGRFIPHTHHNANRVTGR
ncbi:MAG: hypothetical protein IPL28_06965 [Chloroflexi bacterium]|nr:hypothetical protein [Chloroflexota bacterium]